VESHDSEQRLHLNQAQFERPGTSQPRRYDKSAARANKGDRLPGRTMRGERRAQERELAQQPRLTPAEQLELYRRMLSSGELQRRAPDRKRQGISDDRPSVWQLGSWVEGDPPCPDEYLSWEDQ
jgi:hypothetical protein